MSPAGTERSAPIGGVEDLIAYFRDAETPVADFRVGTEHEKIGVYRDGFARVPFEGERGIGALLDRVASSSDGWHRIHEGANLIALEKDGASITLEPGGQLELSGAPLRTLRETCREFNAHVDLLKQIGDELGIVWLALGADPFHATADIPRMPKVRYEIMRAYLPTRGGHALDMMHATATVQANYDYTSESDMASKLRVALGCSPIGSALFANSPLVEGRESGFATRRVDIWRDTDPDRCGMLPFVFEPDFGYRQYAEWALDVPMFFVVRDGKYRALGSTTFREFLDQGIEAEGRRIEPTIADWDLHLTTLFPEVRLKRFIEVRGADASPGPFICALPALWKGILYDDGATADAWSLVAKWTLEERVEGLAAVARDGLRARLAGAEALALARDLLEIADDGLRRIAERGETDGDERHFREPLRERVEEGRSLSDIVLQDWRASGGSAERLLERVRY
jgi:glutamate--cysteine ligase